LEAENINLKKIFYAVSIVCIAFSIVAVSAAQEMPNTKNGTSINADKVSNDSKTINKALKIGDTGKKVVSLQKVLYKQGYYIGKIDGDFGPYTKKALKLFQKDKNLNVTGIVDKKTSSQLKKLGYLKNYNSNTKDTTKTTTTSSKSLKSSDKLVSSDSSQNKSSSTVNSTKKSESSKISSNKTKTSDKSSTTSIKSSTSSKSSKNTITITSLPSAGGTGLSYKWTTNTWVNHCPLCGKDGGLTVNPKGVYEKELTCKYCDADYCGSSGKDKASSSRATLTRA
jgi:cell wall hydrolase